MKLQSPTLSLVFTHLAHTILRSTSFRAFALLTLLSILAARQLASTFHRGTDIGWMMDIPVQPQAYFGLMFVPEAAQAAAVIKQLPKEERQKPSLTRPLPKEFVLPQLAPPVEEPLPPAPVLEWQGSQDDARIERDILAMFPPAALPPRPPATPRRVLNQVGRISRSIMTGRFLRKAR